MIMLEGNNYAQDFSMFTSLPDTNICFQFHYYTLFGTPNMNDYLTLSNNLNAPIWCGEWGEDNLSGLENKLVLLTDPEYKVRGNAFWTWKTVPNSFSFPHYHYAINHPDWNNVMLWATYGSPVVDAVQMQSGIDNFIINMKIQNCEMDTGVAGLLDLCSSTGIRYCVELDSLRVYPNPFTSTINTISNEENRSYELFSSTGEFIWSGKQIGMLDFSSLSSGVYYLKIYYGKSICTKKLIKN